eukprot:TRINITY_DN54115_c0_g1_i1.p1 TRINITY_DN54115_c0_g1~~TRINITY_DN54115_c0_g1_i1.p1  ORF type:complete len:271 (+),score=70.68 TRINITY_DN54115_c0_g1_i1:95-814(+)
MSQVMKYAAVLAFPVLLENEKDPRVKNTPKVDILVTQLNWNFQDHAEESRLVRELQAASPADWTTCQRQREEDKYDHSHLSENGDQDTETHRNGTGLDEEDELEENGKCTQHHGFLIGEHVVETKNKAERVPYALIPKLSGYSVCNPALYNQYSSQPSSIGDFYYDDEYDQDHLGLVLNSLKLEDMEGEMVMRDMLDNVFLSMSIGSSCPNSLDSCESVVARDGDVDVTLVSDDEEYER